MHLLKSEQLFPLGQTVITPHAQTVLPANDIQKALERHRLGDWGDVERDDKELNNEALLEGWRLLSVYLSNAGRKFWIITEADRSVTTILMPEDY